MTDFTDRAAVLLGLLEQYRVVRCVFHPDGIVGLPPELNVGELIALDVGYDLPIPIRDLRIADGELSGVFSFKAQLRALRVEIRALAQIMVASVFTIGWPVNVDALGDLKPARPKLTPVN